MVPWFPARTARGAACAGLVLALVGCNDLERRTERARADVEQGGVPTTSLQKAPEAPSSSDAERAPRAPSPPPATAASDLTTLGYEQGDPGAAIRVIEFSDFGCGYCRRFHLETFPAIKEKYVDTGRVLWQYVPYVLGIFPNGLEAAFAGECAGEQGLIERYGKRLFEDQPEWKQAEDGVDELFLTYAREEGLDAERFTQCIEEGWRRERVRESVIAGGQLGIRGTPTFFIPGYQPVQGALPPEVFEQVLEYVLSSEEAATP